MKKTYVENTFNSQKKLDNILTIIIPRHIDRINKIYSSLKNLGFEVQIKEEIDDIR